MDGTDQESTLNEQVQLLASNQAKITEELKRHRDEINALHYLQIQQEQYSKRCNLRINNVFEGRSIPANANDVTRMVLDWINQNVLAGKTNILFRDAVKAHPLQGKNGPFVPMLIQFTNPKIVEDILDNGKALEAFDKKRITDHQQIINNGENPGKRLCAELRQHLAAETQAKANYLTRLGRILHAKDKTKFSVILPRPTETDPSICINGEIFLFDDLTEDHIKAAGFKFSWTEMILQKTAKSSERQKQRTMKKNAGQFVDARDDISSSSTSTSSRQKRSMVDNSDATPSKTQRTLSSSG